MKNVFFAIKNAYNNGVPGNLLAKPDIINKDFLTDVNNALPVNMPVLPSFAFNMSF